MRRFFALCICAVLPMTLIPAKSFATTNKAIFYIPHQDDETLSFGVSITRHIDYRGADNVIVVLYTDGSGSVAQDMINGTISSSFWGGTHNPAQEGYAPLTDQAFTQARTEEFITALMAMGVKRENIIIEYLNTDGTVTKDEVKEMIRRYEEMYPGASHKAFSYYDSSPDHACAGQALNELYNEGVVTDARFYVSRYDWNRTLPGSLETATDSEARRVRQAAMVYRAWSPQKGAYAIGYHSVHQQFEDMLANIQNKVHKPNQ